MQLNVTLFSLHFACPAPACLLGVFMVLWEVALTCLFQSNNVCVGVIQTLSLHYPTSQCLLFLE